MDTAFARLDRRADSAMTDVSLYRELALLLAKIRCNHTKAEYPATLERFRTEHATHLPARVRVFGKRMFVAKSVRGVITPGTEIVNINGIPAAEVVTRLSRFVAIDGFTDFARSTLLESDDDLMGSDLDHYWPIEFGFTDRWVFALRTASGSRDSVTLAPITFGAWRALGGDSLTVDFRSGTSWSMLDDTTAMLTLRSFVNYRTPIDADSLYRAIFGQLKTRNVRHLIVDLRENGGGSDDASWGLLRYFTDVPVTPLRGVRRRTIRIDSTLAAAFDTWGDRASIFTPTPTSFESENAGWYAERGAVPALAPAPNAFRGHVSLLTGRRNSSGSTMLLAVLQQLGARNGRLRLVGEETGGSAEGPTAGQILFLRLPESRIRVRIPLKRSDVNVSDVVTGLGVFPDVDATETLSDFRAGIDRALVSARTVPWRVPASPLAPTVGVMRGVLEYRDYTGGRRVLLPTVVHTAPIGTRGAFRQRTIYDDGPGNTIYSTDELRIVGDQWIEGAAAADGETADERRALRIVSRRRTPAGLVLVLRGRGMDDNLPAEFRYTVTLGPRIQTRLKEFRRLGGRWEYRHEYRFSRGGPGPV
jgi:Peptidase family S41